LEGGDFIPVWNYSFRFPVGLPLFCSFLAKTVPSNRPQTLSSESASQKHFYNIRRYMTYADKKVESLHRLKG